jgi:HD-GYP domain-containing protein (c-di-GMP phosphodiesterase class II)
MIFTNLHRKLILRLSLGAVLIAGGLGAAVYTYEIEKIDEKIVEGAISEARTFSVENADHMPLLRGKDDPDLKDDLGKFLTRHRNFPDGSFLIAELYDPNRNKVSEAIIPGAEWLEDKLKKAGKHQFPKDESTRYRRLNVGEGNYIQALTALRGPKGDLQGYFEGVYEVSPSRMAEISDLLTTSLGMVVLSVLATALLLYPIIRAQNKGLIRLGQDLLTANIQTLEVLGSAIAKRDSDTHTHNFRVTIYAVRLAQAVGMADREIRELIKGSFLHDVGKIAISDSILLKPGKLDDAEYAVMKTHVAHGIDIVKRSIWLEEASRIVGCHHEKFDGSGYPDRLSGQDIPLGARIFAIADVFDALTSERPYKKAFSLEETMDILGKGAGNHFDPALLAAFAALAPELHAAFGGREDSSVEAAARTLTRPYFEVA